MMRTLLAAAASLLLLGGPAAAERVRDLGTFQSVRSNQLTGYGIVVGLDGSGEAGAGVGVGGDEVGVGGDQEDVVEGDSVGDDLGVFHGTVLVEDGDGVKWLAEWPNHPGWTRAGSKFARRL